MKEGDLIRVWLPLAAGVVGMGYIFVNGSGPNAAEKWIGLVLSAVGLAGVILSRYTLGRSFSVAARATELVTSGIYSRIRNPIYVSGGIFLAGLILIVQRKYLWIVLLAIVVLQVVRARREAQVLEAKFGDAYRAYRARTWF